MLNLPVEQLAWPEAVPAPASPPRGLPLPAQHDARTATPVLLADASWYGTLAAARDLGSRGVPVIVGYDRSTAVTRWSRFTRTAMPCPRASDAARFLAWLLETGAENPGCVLYPTSDDVAFLIAAHRDQLEPLFRLFSPPLEALITVLDKSRLARAAERAGLSPAPTWSPLDEEDVLRLAPELPPTVLIKPRAQILSETGRKGIRVDRPQDVVRAWREMRDGGRVHPWALGPAPLLDRPVIQPYLQTSEAIYTVDGFVDAEGKIRGALACIKSLQMPRRSGAGILFEETPLERKLLHGLQRLCRQTGYVGVFDAEFVVQGEEKLLIDFNPRFYNHMAYEIDRGLPLPWLAYLSATGQSEALARARLPRPLRSSGPGGVYLHRLPARLTLAAQRLSGGMSAAECRRWRRSIARQGVLTDAALSHGDPLPACADALELLRHPRALVRKAARH